MPSSPTFSLSIGGVGFCVGVPDDAWRSALAPLYADFPLEAEADWQVTLVREEGLAQASKSWIEHTGPLTRFHVERYAGWIDLDKQEALVRTASLAGAPAAVERTVAYACMQMLPRARASLLLHAAGILWQGRGLVVSGHSGAGKTTVARLSLGHGELFNDEMVIVDLAGPQPLLRSTPFLGRKTPPELARRGNRSAPASALVLLKHAPDFTLVRLSSSAAVMELLRTDIAAVERLASAEAWMAMVERLVQAVPVYHLGFRPTVELWEFLAGALERA